jgi:hypothetical protein
VQATRLAIDLVRIHFRIKPVPSFDDWIHDFFEGFPRFLVSCCDTHTKVSRLDPGLNGIGEGITLGRFHIFQLFEELRGEVLEEEGGDQSVGKL